MKGRNFANEINGKPVVNATRRITIHIEPKDIYKGAVRKDKGACAAAKAAMREIPNCTMARIHLGRCYIYNAKQGHWLRYKTTNALRSEIVAFDRGGKFEPGEYDLKPLAPTDLMPKKKDYQRTDTNRTANASSHTKMPRKLHVTKGVRQHAGNR